MGIGTGKKNEKNYSYPRERLLKVGLLTRAERISLSMAEGRPWELLVCVLLDCFLVSESLICRYDGRVVLLKSKASSTHGFKGLRVLSRLYGHVQVSSSHFIRPFCSGHQQLPQGTKKSIYCKDPRLRRDAM